MKKRLSALVALVLWTVAAAAAPAHQDMLLGSWVGSDRAAESIYGVLTITEGAVRWGGTNKYNQKCSSTYVVQKEMPGTEFKDVLGHVFVTSENPSFQTFLLVLNPGKCGRITKLRLTFPVPDEPNTLAVVEYQGEISGYMGFHRK